jgi:glutamate carboxypeptidase
LTALLDQLRSQTGEMVDILGELVAAESPSKDLDATARCAKLISEIGQRIVGSEPDRIEVEGRTYVSWRFGHPEVLLLGHFDTVWPLGTIETWPSISAAGTVVGPGSFDMKAGIVQGLFALRALGNQAGVHLLLTSDEEVGSFHSREVIEESARQVKAVLVLEPSEGGALKIARKGTSGYHIHVEGVAAHAGIEPHKGVNALVELAVQILKLEEIAGVGTGTTVTPTVASAGTTGNTVPANAEVYVDVRAATIEEQERVDREMNSLSPTVKGATVKVTGGSNRPPLQTSASVELFELAQQVANELGLGPLRSAEVGGGSDGNFTAALGVKTLDGLGAVGGGAHALSEHVQVDAMAERAGLVAGLVERIRAG